MREGEFKGEGGDSNVRWGGEERFKREVGRRGKVQR